MKNSIVLVAALLTIDLYAFCKQDVSTVNTELTECFFDTVSNGETIHWYALSRPPNKLVSNDWGIFFHGFSIARPGQAYVDSPENLIKALGLKNGFHHAKKQTLLLFPMSQGKCETYIKHFSTAETASLQFLAAAEQLPKELADVIKAKGPGWAAGHSGSYKILPIISQIRSIKFLAYFDASYFNNSDIEFRKKYVDPTLLWVKSDSSNKLFFSTIKDSTTQSGLYVFLKFYSPSLTHTQFINFTHQKVAKIKNVSMMSIDKMTDDSHWRMVDRSFSFWLSTLAF